MTSEAHYDFPKKGVNPYVVKYIRSLKDLTGKVVLDIPCGDGRASHEFIKRGAEVKAVDMFPHFMKLEEIEAEYADLTEILPIESSSVDYIICQEGIEHVPNQLKLLEEFNRVLKIGGTLLITTPNYSQVSARLSRFFLESDYWQRMPPTEIDSIWFADDDSNKLYYGHLFLIGAQRLQSLLTIAGFKTEKRIKTEIGNTSLVLGIILWPLFAFTTLVSWLFYKRKNNHIEKVTRNKILRNRARLNLSPKTLFCKHIFWELRKEHELSEAVARLKTMHRKQ